MDSLISGLEKSIYGETVIEYILLSTDKINTDVWIYSDFESDLINKIKESYDTIESRTMEIYNSISARMNDIKPKYEEVMSVFGFILKEEE